MITKKQFLADVLHEATVLKNLATEEEKNNLDFSSLDPTHTGRCIYGQMTGYCASPRAKFLMDKACVRTTNTEGLKRNPTGLVNDNENTWKNIKPLINGEYTGQSWGKPNPFVVRNYSYMSMIETYICLDTANNKGLISYIKGEIDTVKL